MFLNQLDIREKEAFMELANWISNVDVDIHDATEEEKVLALYLYEMGMEDNGYQLKNRPLSSILSDFESERSKNIAFIEMFALVFADGIYTDEEKHAVNEITKQFGFTVEKQKRFETWIIKVNDIYAEGSSLIDE